MNLDGYMFMVGEGRSKSKQLKFKPIGVVKGETLDDRFHDKGAFQLNSFKWESKKDTTAANRADPTISLGAFSITKGIDNATPTLFMANAICAVFPGCHVYFRKAAGPKLSTFFHAVFSDVTIEDWQINFAAGVAEESLTFRFDWCELNYYPQTTEGSRKKGDIANTRQFCTSKPESQDVPRVFRKEDKSDGLQEGDLDFLR